MNKTRPRHEILVDYVVACLADGVVTPGDLVVGGFDRLARAVRDDAAAAFAELKRRGGANAAAFVAAKFAELADRLGRSSR